MDTIHDPRNVGILESQSVKNSSNNYGQQKQRYKSICNVRHMQSSDDMVSPTNELLRPSGFKFGQRNMGSRNNSPSSTKFGNKVSVNSSFGIIKFNISMEEDKLKSIRRRAKNKGLFAFDGSSSIKLKK